MKAGRRALGGVVLKIFIKEAVHQLIPVSTGLTVGIGDSALPKKHQRGRKNEHNQQQRLHVFLLGTTSSHKRIRLYALLRGCYSPKSNEPILGGTCGRESRVYRTVVIDPRCRHAESVESAMNTGAAERNRYVHSGRKSPKEVPRRSDNYNHFASSLRF